MIYGCLFPAGSAWQVSRACRVLWGRLWMMSCRPTSGTLSTWTKLSPLCFSTCRVESVLKGECSQGKHLLIRFSVSVVSSPIVLCLLSFHVRSKFLWIKSKKNILSRPEFQHRFRNKLHPHNTWTPEHISLLFMYTGHVFASVNRKQIVNSGQLLGYRKYNEQGREMWLLFNYLYNLSAKHCKCPFLSLFSIIVLSMSIST